MAKTKHPILNEYNLLKESFNQNPLASAVTDIIINIHNECQNELKSKQKHNLNPGNGTIGKTYFYFSDDKKRSRPVNQVLFEDGYQPATDFSGNPVKNQEGLTITKADWFLHNLKNNTIKNQSADDITSALYAISMEFCCSTDLIASNSQKICGTYFEKLIGHIYSRHLNVAPSSTQYACELDSTSIKIPTDFIFNLGANMPKFDVPVKTSTRERCVEVWAQQRILDGAYGAGRFLGLLTCISEAKMNSESKDHSKWKVDDVCVPNQWINYQLFIAQIKRAYYLDVPNRYDQLNNSFPRIHVKKFGEFFFEWEDLLD